MLMWMGNMKDKNELRIKCCSGSQDVGCGFDYRPDRNIVGGRWARRSLTANSHRRMTYASASTMTHHSSSCSRSSTYLLLSVICRAVRKVRCLLGVHPLKIVHVPSFKQPLPPDLDCLSWQHFHHVFRINFIFSDCGMPYHPRRPDSMINNDRTAIIPN